MILIHKILTKKSYKTMTLSGLKIKKWLQLIKVKDNERNGLEQCQLCQPTAKGHNLKVHNK